MPGERSGCQKRHGLSVQSILSRELPLLCSSALTSRYRSSFLLVSNPFAHLFTSSVWALSSGLPDSYLAIDSSKTDLKLSRLPGSSQFRLFLPPRNFWILYGPHRPSKSRGGAKSFYEGRHFEWGTVTVPSPAGPCSEARSM